MRHRKVRNLISTPLGISKFAGGRGISVMEQPESNRFPEEKIMAARLERLADVRRNVVTRGKALIANPNYPDRKTVRGVARVLAQHWRPQR